MRRSERIKTLQLFVYIVLLGVALATIVMKGTGAATLTTLLWIVLGASFFFIFIDFNLYERQKKEYNTMMESLLSDPVAKVANRYSIDNLIDRYVDQPLPAGFCCIAFEITNLREINTNYSRKMGNEVLRQFSIILKMAALDRYFVGRNGSSRFMAMTQGTTETITNVFLDRIAEKVQEFNDVPSNPSIEYKVGTAYLAEDPSLDIISMVALSNRRIDQPGYVVGDVKEGANSER